MEKSKKVIGSYFYILPSSLHEVILMPKNEFDPKYLGDIVREINTQEVERDEILSDHVYEYNFKEKEIQTVKESMLRHKQNVSELFKDTMERMRANSNTRMFSAGGENYGKLISIIEDVNIEDVNMLESFEIMRKLVEANMSWISNEQFEAKERV